LQQALDILIPKPRIVSPAGTFKLDPQAQSHHLSSEQEGLWTQRLN